MAIWHWTSAARGAKNAQSLHIRMQNRCWMRIPDHRSPQRGTHTAAGRLPARPRGARRRGFFSRRPADLAEGRVSIEKAKGDTSVPDQVAGFGFPAFTEEALVTVPHALRTGGRSVAIAQSPFMIFPDDVRDVSGVDASCGATEESGHSRITLSPASFYFSIHLHGIFVAVISNRGRQQ